MSLGNSKLIQASAGTGKTYALSGQFISLLLAGEDPSTILASTFTRKAAGEILERIYLRLAKAYFDPNARLELAKQAGLKSLEAEKVEEALKRLVDKQSKLKVATLDSFASSIARAFTEELGLPSNWRIQEESSSNLQLSLAVAAVCSSLKSDQVASLVTAIRRGESSRSVTHAIRNIVGTLIGIFQETDASAWNWIKASPPLASEKDKLLTQLSFEDLPKTKAGEINKLAFKAMQSIIDSIKNEDWSSILEQTLVSNVLEGKNKFSTSQLSDLLIEKLKYLAKIAAEHSLARLADANLAAYGLLLAVINELKLAEDLSGNISFERIIRRLVRLGKGIFSDELYFRIDTQIHHVLLDEFQDTSLIQWQLLEPLIEEKVSKQEVTSSFFCVGDGKQAIYGWRGGNTSIFDSIPGRWPQIDVQTLETSYRSQPAIVDTVNQVFSSLLANPNLADLTNAIKSWTNKFNSHSTNVADNSSLVEFYSIDADLDSESYLERVFAKLLEISEKNPLANIGILVRSNSDISTLLDLAHKFNISLSVQGGTPLTRFSLISSFLALLSLINNPGNSIKRYEASSAPWCRDIDYAIREFKQSLGQFGLSRSLRTFANSNLSSLSEIESRALEQFLSLAIKEEVSNKDLDLSRFIKLVESSAVENPSNNKIQILTIHKSKGLEFDIVFIPDLSWGLKPKDKPDFLIERDPVNLRAKRVSLPDKQSLRSYYPELASMSRQKYEDDFQEALSLLYVALTRAKSEMYLFTPKAALSSNSITAASLIAFKIPVIEDLLENLQQRSKITPVLSKTVTKQETATLFKLSSKNLRSRGLGRVSPSSLIESESSSLLNENQAFGSAIHRLFAETVWFEECLEENKLRRILQSFLNEEALITKILNSFFNYLNLDSVKQILQRPEKAQLEQTQVYTEKPFIYREGNYLMQGRIDRIVVSQNSGLIIDFKVGKTPEIPLLKGYIQQIEIYKKAASFLFPSKSFTAAILFLGDGNRIDL